MLKSIFVSLLAVSGLFISCNNTVKNTENVTNSVITPEIVNPEERFLKANFIKKEYQIPMRDGVKLFTSVYIPKNTDQKHPILFSRTPYSVGPYGTSVADFKTRDLLWYKELLTDGYIFVYQDARGRYMSEGEFTNMTPYIPNKKDKTQVDESTDTYDSIEWLIKNIENNNGNVGMLGISYRGYYSTYGAIDAHPALKCISPQAPMADVYFDDFHHNGAFFLSYFGYYPVFGVPKTKQEKASWFTPVDFGTKDGYKFFMELGPLKNGNSAKYFNHQNEFWNQMVAHPNYDEFWQKRNILPHLKDIKPAVMTVGGWYDAEDLYGSFKTYQAFENQNPNIHNILVAGPWIHGGWSRTDGSTLGNVYFGEDISQFYRDSISKPFFDFYLKGKGELNLPEAFCFETGVNQWRRFDQWPPKNCRKANLYLNPKGKLSFNAPKDKNKQANSFISDPANPVPYTEELTTGMTKEYMTDDQRFASRRPDVLVYETEILDDNLTLAGNLFANLFVSTSQTDADWIVKLIDVYPDNHPVYPHNEEDKAMGGYQQMVRSEVLRGRYRNDFSKPEPFTPNQATKIKIELLDLLHTFKKGHKIMVQIQSTWFPLIDRNPQKYVENIFLANEEDFVKAEHKVYLNQQHPSHLELRILQ